MVMPQRRCRGGQVKQEELSVPPIPGREGVRTGFAQTLKRSLRLLNPKMTEAGWLGLASTIRDIQAAGTVGIHGELTRGLAAGGAQRPTLENHPRIAPEPGGMRSLTHLQAYLQEFTEDPCLGLDVRASPDEQAKRLPGAVREFQVQEDGPMFSVVVA